VNVINKIINNTFFIIYIFNRCYLLANLQRLFSSHKKKCKKYNYLKKVIKNLQYLICLCRFAETKTKTMNQLDYDLDRYYSDLDKANDCELCNEPTENRLCEQCEYDNIEDLKE